MAIAVLASGGLDSCALLAALAQETAVHPLFVEAGLAWEREEQKALQAFIDAVEMPSIQPVETLEVPVGSLYRNHWSVTGEGVPGADTPDEAVFLPGRNILLLSHASVWCSLRGVHQIAMGTLNDNPFSDASPQFFRRLGDVLSEGLDHPIEVVTPFRQYPKWEVIRDYGRLPLEFSLSCMAPVNGIHCGDCNKCHERQVAFREAGIVDNTRYTK